MNVYPSILTKDAETVFTYIEKTKNLFTHYQIDLTDNVFVPYETAQAHDLVAHATKNNLNYHDTHTCEIHLMVQDFKYVMDDLHELDPLLPISRVIVHMTPLKHWAKVYLSDNKKQSAAEFLKKKFKFDFAVALNPNVTVEDNIELISHFSAVQLMTVIPGKQGQPLEEYVLNKIEELRSFDYKGEIILDGAMNKENVIKILKMKFLPDTITPGSYLAEDTENRLKALQEVLASHKDS